MQDFNKETLAWVVGDHRVTSREAEPRVCGAGLSAAGCE